MTTTPVVDIGCHSHPEHRGRDQDSIARLIARFRPRELHGFDPHHDLVEGTTRIGRTRVTRTRAAAWTRDGLTGFALAGLASHTCATTQDNVVPCFDLARWLAGRRVILKMDIEGAEYPLLEHVHAQGRDANIERLLVEWHGPPNGPEDWEARRDALLRSLRCPVEDWEPVAA